MSFRIKIHFAGKKLEMQNKINYKIYIQRKAMEVSCKGTSMAFSDLK
ncbi:hypothetical protein AusDCA_3011 [Desulfitobacterium sp. AusDCA]